MRFAFYPSNEPIYLGPGFECFYGVVLLLQFLLGKGFVDLSVAGGTQQRDLLHLLPGERPFGAFLAVAAARYEVVPG